MSYDDFRLSTPRGELRAWREEDAEAAFEIYRNPDVMQYLGGTPTASVQDQRDSIQRSVRMSRLYPVGQGSFAFWVNEELLGCGMLKPIPLTEQWDKWKAFRMEGAPLPAFAEIEVGWHLRQDVWGKGYATEMGRALLDFGFGTLKLPEIIAVVNPANAGSIAVAERLEMPRSGLTMRYYDQEVVEFRLKAS